MATLLRYCFSGPYASELLDLSPNDCSNVAAGGYGPPLPPSTGHLTTGKVRNYHASENLNMFRSPCLKKKSPEMK
jgi:hypothetical protein